METVADPKTKVRYGKAARRNSGGFLLAAMRFARSSRKFHRIGAVVSAIPVLIVLVTGIVLQLKKEFSWIQPPTANNDGPGLEIAFDDVLAAIRTVPEAGLQSWDDVDRLDVRPAKGIIKVRGKNRWEVQVSATSGKVLQAAYRRSDFFEELHDGSWFSDSAKLWIFLPAAVILLILWITGAYLWLLPYRVRRAKRQRLASNEK